MISSDYIIWIFFAGYILGMIIFGLISLLNEWNKNRKYKIITRDIIVNSYDEFQEYYKNEFKRSMNDQLRNYIKLGKELPIQITYRKIFSESSLNELRNYIEQELKFKDFELEQHDDIGLRLILK